LFEIIQKQARVILGIEGLDDATGLTVKLEQQAEYEKRLGGLQEEKRVLYERLIIGEIDATEYRAEKAVLDAEISRLAHAVDTLKSEADLLSAAKASGDKLRRVAGAALSTDRLTRPFVDLLIDKVYVFPDSRVEIVWKVGDFGSVEYI